MISKNNNLLTINVLFKPNILNKKCNELTLH